MRFLLIFSLLLSVLICGDMFQVFSEGPTTPKILFSSSQDSNTEVYMMSPDDSEQMNLTQHPAGDRGCVVSDGWTDSLRLGSQKKACVGPASNGRGFV